MQRTRTPAEIRAEYEQLAEERAERRKQQRTNPHGTITININATDMFNPYEDLGLDELEYVFIILSLIVTSFKTFSKYEHSFYFHCNFS